MEKINFRQAYLLKGVVFIGVVGFVLSSTIADLSGSAATDLRLYFLIKRRINKFVYS